MNRTPALIGATALRENDSPLGFEGRKDYTAICPVTNLADRLGSEAQHGQLLVSDRVLSFVKAFVTTESIGELTLKGM